MSFFGWVFWIISTRISTFDSSRCSTLLFGKNGAHLLVNSSRSWVKLPGSPTRILCAMAPGASTWAGGEIRSRSRLSLLRPSATGPGGCRNAETQWGPGMMVRFTYMGVSENAMYPQYMVPLELRDCSWLQCEKLLSKLHEDSWEDVRASCQRLTVVQREVLLFISHGKEVLLFFKS